MSATTLRRGREVAVGRPLEVAQLLDRSAGRLELGWTQGALVRRVAGAPHYCATGAVLADVEAGDWTKVDALAVLDSWIGMATLPLWNNDPKRTQAEVVQLVRTAAAALGAPS